MEFNGKALADLPDPKDPAKTLVKKGEQLAAFAQLKDDGTTASGCWIFCGAWTQAGNQMGRRDNSDPTGIGQTLNWAWASRRTGGSCTTARRATLPASRSTRPAS